MHEPLSCQLQQGDNEAQKWDRFLLFFFPVLAFGMAYAFKHRIGALPTTIPVFDSLVLIAATYRVIRLSVYDSITRFIRDWLMRGNAFMRSCGHILGCPWCAGIWFSFAVLVFYILLPEYFILLILLALAGAASFFQVLSKMIGNASVHLEQ